MKRSLFLKVKPAPPPPEPEFIPSPSLSNFEKKGEINIGDFWVHESGAIAHVTEKEFLPMQKTLRDPGMYIFFRFLGQPLATTVQTCHISEFYEQFRRKAIMIKGQWS